MKQMKIIYSVALSLLSLVGAMDAKSSIPSSDFTWSKQEIIGAVCIGGLCCTVIGAIFYINRLEKLTKEQGKRIDAQNKRIDDTIQDVKHKADFILSEKSDILNVKNEIIKEANEAYDKKIKTYDEKFTKIEPILQQVQTQQQADKIILNRLGTLMDKRKVIQRSHGKRITKLEEENTFYDMNSPCNTASE